ncbi:MAG: hypothetical protein ACHRXM_18715 [Isosphaerales bacterium]
MNDRRRPETSPRDPETRPRSGPNSSAYAWLIQDLEWVRELVLERLSSIETLARERRASTPPLRDIAELEVSFKKKSDQLEETRRRLQDQAEREKHDWNASLSQLEDDRRLLAEAWERVEQERIDSMSAPQANPAHHSLGQNPQTTASTGLPHTAASIPIRSAGTDSDPCNPVARAILRQFQTLCSDVRQSAQGRRAAR